MSQQGIYSELKPAWWFAREGKLPDAPKQVQLILSDLCNQDCHFCLTEDTMIDTTDGWKAIADIVVGDLVWGPTGSICRVEKTSARQVSEVYEIEADGNTIQATAEHPFLTANGWKRAGDLTASDSAVVRVRMREPSRKEAGEMEPVFAASLQHDERKASIAEGSGLRFRTIQLERGLALRQIDSIRRITGSFTVYNFSCSTEEAYEAEGFVVHNCAYRMSGYTSNELFVGESEPSAYGHNNPKRFIPTERALSLLDEFKELGVLAVQMTGGGEPTVHKDHEKIFDKTLKLGMKASLVSNGVRWRQKLIKEILPQFSWVRVSIDAGNEDSYAAIRRTSIYNWQQVWQNVTNLAKNIEDQGTSTALGLGFVVTPTSFEEIVPFTRLAKASGAHNVRFTAMFSPEDEKPYTEIYPQIVDRIEFARDRFGSEDFTIHDNFGSRFEDLKQHAPDYQFCSYQYYTAYVGGDLRPYRCCVQSYSERGKIANAKLDSRSFSEFWNSEERKKDFQEFDARGCERCQFQNKNRAMNYLMQLDPGHKEFP